jgi:hypothetical protein
MDVRDMSIKLAEGSASGSAKPFQFEIKAAGHAFSLAPETSEDMFS